MSNASDACVAAEVARACYGAALRLRPLGSFNAVFRLEHADGDRILKLAKTADGASVRKELALIRLLVQANVPAPEVEHADPTGARAGRPFFIMRSAGAHTAAEWTRAHTGSGPYLFHEMGTLLARIHGITFAHGGDIHEDRIVDRDVEGFLHGVHGWADQLVQAGHLSAAEAQALRDRPLPTFDGHTLCHSDFHAVQCIVRDGRITAVVDWESAWAGNPMVDLAVTRAYFDCYASPDLVARFAEGYRSVRPVAPRFEHAYLPVRMISLLVFLRAWHGQGERAWRHAVARGRVARIVDLYRRYGARLDG